MGCSGLSSLAVAILRGNSSPGNGWPIPLASHDAVHHRAIGTCARPVPRDDCLSGPVGPWGSWPSVCADCWASARHERFDRGPAVPPQTKWRLAKPNWSPGPDDWPWWRGPAQRHRPPRHASAGVEPVAKHRLENSAARPGTLQPGDLGRLGVSDDRRRGPGTQSLLCFNFADGQLRWNVPVTHGKLPIKHEQNSHASATPACDGTRVCRTGDRRFDSGRGAVAGRKTSLADRRRAVRLAARLRVVAGAVWFAADRQRREPRFQIGSHPQDQLHGSSTGTAARSYWRISRPNDHSFGSPTVGHIAGSDQLIVAGSGRVDAYDPATGEPIWNCKSIVDRTANTPAFDDNHVYVSGSYQQSEILCIRADGSGDVSNTHVVWTASRGASDVPSPLLLGKRLYLLQDKGVLSCYDAASGKLLAAKAAGRTISRPRRWSPRAGSTCRTSRAAPWCSRPTSNWKFWPPTNCTNRSWPRPARAARAC